MIGINKTVLSPYDRELIFQYMTTTQFRAFISGIIIIAGSVQADTLFFPLGLTPLYEKPVPNGFPIAFLEPADTCNVDSSASQGTGITWLRIRSKNLQGWVTGSSMREMGNDRGESRKRVGAYNKSDPDAKRRYRILEQHTDWPRRIVTAIREGNICLDMNEEQLSAAWGNPLRKTRAFILGAGQQELWFFKGEDGVILAVFLNRGRVVGWSE
jgi:hypothetical protein